MFLRMLHNVILYHIVHRSRSNVGIVLSFPDADKPEARVAAGNQYYAYSKKMVVGLTAPMTGDPVQPSGTDGSTVQVVEGCLVKERCGVCRDAVRPSGRDRV